MADDSAGQGDSGDLPPRLRELWRRQDARELSAEDLARAREELRELRAELQSDLEKAMRIGTQLTDLVVLMLQRLR